MKSNETPKRSKGRPAKMINAPGSSNTRVAQACDRCRAKKTKCDGQLPTCSSCAAIGFKCIVSDKLSRRAFPKGYTETLEERIRQLEAENMKLTGLLNLKDEQVSKLNSDIKEVNNSSQSKSGMLTSTNLELLDTQTNDTLHSHRHDHHDGVPCSCSNHPHFVHERPVSIAGSFYNPESKAGSIRLSDDDNESFLSIEETDNLDFEISSRSNREASPAPGAFAAATAIAKMQHNLNSQINIDGNSNQSLLTSLVAASIPRSTEETLFIPALLAKICQTYGYSSKPAILTANAIASLKELPNQPNNSETKLLHQLIMNRYDVNHLPQDEAIYFVTNLLHLPSRVDLDLCMTIYFQEWGNVLPIVDKNSFVKNYMIFTKVLDRQVSDSSQATYESLEQFGATLVLVLALSMLHTGGETLSYYDYLVTEFIKPNCIVTKSCSIQSLQILSLALQYCLATGDTATCYELRGRVISMAQQLRMHRCPAAVLGISSKFNENVNIQNSKQAERRILFWCIYSLDVYTSLALGVPRLLKDFEIECAIPFAGKSDDPEDNINILVVNNTKLQIVGKVSKFTLSVMLYSKVLGSILDSIFSRYESGESSARTLSRERMLDTWRRELPAELKFEMDVNGLSLSDKSLDCYTRQQRTLIFMYYHAKILIYLPVISKHGDHNNVGLSQKEVIFKETGDFSTSVISSTSIIQQSSISILEVLRSVDFLPIPVNLPRQQVRLALIVAKGAIDYVKNGALYHNSRTLLLDTVQALNNDVKRPGSITNSSVKLLELAILSILGLNLNKSIIKKKIYKTATSKTISSSSQISGSKLSTVIIKGDNPQDDLESKFPHKSNSLPDSQKWCQKTVNSQKHQPQNQLQNISESCNTHNDHNDQIQSLHLNKWDSFASNQNNGTELFDLNVESEENKQSNLEEEEKALSDINNFLDFDPFKINVSHDLLMNEFAADGSLGLVPFLEMNNTKDIHEYQAGI